jgi:aurora kinase
LQFRRKPSNDGRNTSNNLAKSPIKSTSRATSNLSSSSQLYEPLKPSKPINTKLTLEDFTLGKKLGEGRFGVVWLAIHKLTGAIFALKKIAKSIIKESFMIDQFILEVKIQSFIEHSYIVNIFGIFDDEESIYLLLEYLEGGTLYNSLKKKSNGKF